MLNFINKFLNLFRKKKPKTTVEFLSECLTEARNPEFHLTEKEWQDKINTIKRDSMNYIMNLHEGQAEAYNKYYKDNRYKG